MNEPGQIKVAVCIPCGDEVKTDFALSLAAMLQTNRMQLEPDAGIVPIRYELLNMRTANLAFSRNELASTALARGADFVLFIDSDMRLPPFTACRLIEVAKKTGVDIVGVPAASRVQGAVWRGEPAQGVREVQSLGTGVLLISAAVFRKVAEPWFLFELAPGDHAPAGEDSYFTRKARAAGFKLAADYDLSRDVAHVGTFSFTLNERADVDAMRSVTDKRGNWGAPIRVIEL